MSNLYHLLQQMPAVEPWEMPPALERAAGQLVRSGKLRIHADSERNFVRHGTADSDATYTARELTDPGLLPATRKKLARHVPPMLGTQGVEDLLQRLLGELKKARGVSEAKEMQVARVLMQAAHPAVMQSVLELGVEVYVSYAHNVGDLMAVHEWQGHGLSNGLQATSDTGASVFVSAGGDPFFAGEEKTYTTDGFPALARMMVIAAQELGHFADLQRTKHGMGGRLSATFLNGTRPSRDGKAARDRDLAVLGQRMDAYARSGLAALRRAEQGVNFYHAQRRFTPPWIYWQLRRLIAWTRFAARCKQQGLFLPLRVLPPMRHGEAVEAWLADMAFNLAPNAEVYRRADAQEEEAIAVIEAVARVPQQVVKWGHAAVEAAWPGLYRFYYGPVIENVKTDLRTIPPSNNMNIYQMISSLVRRAIRVRPGYYPERPKRRKKS